MPTTIAENAQFKIVSESGGIIREDTVLEGTEGLGRAITFTVVQKNLQINTVYLQITPASSGAETGDFWEVFFSNKIGGEPADQFALGKFVRVSTGSGRTSFNLNADTAVEQDELFTVTIYDGLPGLSLPLLSGTFTITDDDRVVFGTASDDVLVAGAQASSVYGFAGDDRIASGSGDDRIDGGEGIDTATYSANHSNFKLTLGPSSTTITDRSGAEGTDTLIDIEQLAFTNRTLDLTNYSSLTQLNDAQFSDLAKVYVAYFNRAADAEGLYFWADKLAEGMDMATIASYFSQSAEAKALYPDTADTSAFVTAVYANVLGRTPDQAGFDFWTTNLDNGSMQPATFVLSIIGGAQGADITYLSKKADLGVYFSAIKGMSDVADAQNVLNIFGDQATSNTAGAKTSVDGHYSDATASGGGEFIFELVGIVNDPFAGVI